MVVNNSPEMDNADSLIMHILKRDCPAGLEMNLLKLLYVGLKTYNKGII